jgi:outer membrane protein TolC
MIKCRPSPIDLTTILLWLFLLPSLLPGNALAAPLTFRQAVELAAGHSVSAIASTDQERSHQAYVEAKSLYLPQMVAGSAIGYSAGLPLTLEGAAPSLFNATAQQSIFSPAQRSFVKSAHAEWQASTLAQSEIRRQMILDAAIAYVDLASINLQMQLLRQQHDSATRLVHIEIERVKETGRVGVDLSSGSSLMRAKLIEAQTRMRSAELDGSAVQVRKRLADLTGLPAQEIETVPDSIPPVPDEAAPNAAQEAADNDLRVRIAAEQFRVSVLHAQGEHKLLWPSVEAVGQYALLSTFNNYDQFYKRFERNNGTVGLVVRFGFLNRAQTARAREADADAVKAERRVGAIKSQVSGEVLQAQALVKQLTAARDMAQIEYALSRSDTEKLDVNAEIGKIALGEQITGRITTDQKFEELLDTTFELRKAQLQMLNAIGDLDRWILAQTPLSVAEQSMASGSVSESVPRVGPQSFQIRSLMVAPDVSVLPAGKSRQFFAAAIGSDGKGTDVTSIARWYSSNDSIAIVSTSGFVTALTSGQISITVSLSGVWESMQITVTEPEAEPE